MPEMNFRRNQPPVATNLNSALNVPAVKRVAGILKIFLAAKTLRLQTRPVVAGGRNFLGGKLLPTEAAPAASLAQLIKKFLLGDILLAAELLLQAMAQDFETLHFAHGLGQLLTFYLGLLMKHGHRAPLPFNVGDQRLRIFIPKLEIHGSQGQSRLRVKIVVEPIQLSNQRAEHAFKPRPFQVKSAKLGLLLFFGSLAQAQHGGQAELKCRQW